MTIIAALLPVWLASLYLAYQVGVAVELRRWSRWVDERRSRQ